MPSDLTIPRLTDPKRYTGLYLVQFPHGTAVGYLADEVALLLAMDEYRDAPVYRIHRVDDAGRLELIGIAAGELVGEEHMLFAASDPQAAGAIFAEIRRQAKATPPPCPVRIELIDLPEFDPPHAVGLIYPRHASTILAAWLLRTNFAGGETVVGGAEARRLRQSAANPIASTMLPFEAKHRTRSREEILASVGEPVQR